MANKISPSQYYEEYYKKNPPKSGTSGGYVSPADYYESYYSKKSSRSQTGYLASNRDRYKLRYADMISDPVKYYDAYGGKSTVFNTELAYYEYMSKLSDYDLPDEYTYYAQRYDDMRANPQKYLDAYGGDVRTYKSELERYKELYGIEKKQTSQVISLIQGRVSNDFLTETGLDQYFTYNASDPTDALLQELGYAPSSFKYKVDDIEERVNKGYSAENYFKTDKDGNLTDDGFFLATLYAYDENDPEDVLNRALGLMPKAFKYGTSDDEKQRERMGLLPETAEMYVNNSKTFATEYSEYAEKMQQYADELHEYENLPWLTRMFTPKPQNPYPSELDVPESVQALMKYKTDLQSADTAEHDYFDTKEGTVKKPHFFFSESLPLSIDEFDISDYATKKQAVKDSVLSKIPLVDLLPKNAANAIDQYAQQTVENDFLQELKESGEYDKIMAEQAAQDTQFGSTLAASFSEENYNLLAESDLLSRLDIVGGMEEVNNMAVKALKDSAAPELMAALRNFRTVPDSSMAGVGMWDAIFATDPEIQNIKEMLDALGWKGEGQSDNNEIQSLLKQAEYRVLQLRGQNVEAYREALKYIPSWLLSTASGGAKGVENWGASISTVAVEMAKFNPFVMLGGAIAGRSAEETREEIDNVSNYIATSSAERDYVNQQNIARARGASEFTTNTLYNASAAAVEMGINMAIGAGIGSAVGGAGTAASSATQAAKAAKTGASAWSKLAQKLLVNPRSASFFVSSLGHNLMEGELEGRSDSEKWLAAIPSAYVETVIEQSFGFFSGRGTPIGALVKNGVKNVTWRTLGNVGLALAENTIGETIEENLQDLVNTGFRDLFYENYDPSFAGKDGYFDWDRIGDTTKTTMLIGLALSVFGLGGAVGDVRAARNAELSFNKAVEAYQAGDMATFDAEMKKFGKNLKRSAEALEEPFRDGKLDKLLEGMTPDTAAAQMLENMRSAMYEAAELRTARDIGMPVSQADINMADARANAAINAIKVGLQGQRVEAASKYDQVATSPELTEIVNKGGFASRLIRENPGRLSEMQVNIVKDLDAQAAQNPYIDVTFAPSETVDSLMSQSQKLTQKHMEASTELQRTITQAQEAFQAQYNINRKAGRIEYQRQVEKIRSLNKRVESLRQKAQEAGLKVDAFSIQQTAAQAFSGANLLLQNGAIMPGVQQAIDNSGNIAYNENNGGGTDANVGRGTQGEVYNGVDGREGLLSGGSGEGSRLLLLNTSQKTHQVEAREAYRDDKGAVYELAEPAAFHDLIGDAIQSNSHGAYVHQYEVTEYAEKRLFVTDDGMAGVAVTADGDIVSLFKNPASGKSGVATSLLITALKNGGVKLDCFDGFLSRLYQDHGFVPVSRVAFNDEFAPDGWNFDRDGRPDIVFFTHNGDSVEQVLERRGTYERADINNVPLYGSYEDAQAARDALVGERQGNMAEQPVEAVQSFREASMEEGQADTVVIENEREAQTEIQRLTADEKLTKTRTDIAEYRKAVDALRTAHKVKVDTRDMSLTEVAAALENHAQYLEDMAAGAKDLKKPSISVKGLMPNEIESIGKALANKQNAVADLRALAKDIRKRADAEISAAQSQLLKTLRKESRSSNMRRMSTEYQNFIDYWVDRIDLKSKTITEKKQGELEQLRASYEGMEMPADVKQAVSRLDKMRVTDMDIADIEELSNTIAAMRKIEMERIGEEKQITGQKFAESRKVTIANMPKVEKQKRGLFTKYGTWSPQVMAENLQSMRDDGFYNRAVLPIQQGVNTHGRNNMWLDKNVAPGMKDFIKKYGADQSLSKSQYNRIKKTYDSTLGVKMTEPELLGLYSNLLDTQTYEEIAENGVYGMDFENTHYEFDRAQLREFVDTFEQTYPHLAKTYGSMRAALDYFQKPVNDTFRHVKGYDLVTQRQMNENPMYFPKYKTDYRAQEPSAENPMPDSLSYSFTKERTGGGTVKLYNPAWVISKYTREANNYVSYAGAVHDAHVILETPDIKEGMKMQARDSKGRHTVYEYWRSYLKDIVVGPRMQEFDGVFGKIVGNYARANITFNPAIALGQIASYPAAMGYIKPQYLVNPINLFAEAKSRFNKAYMDYVYDVAPHMYDRIVKGQSMYEIAYMAKSEGKLSKVFNGRMLREADRIINLAWFDAAVKQTKAENPGLDMNSAEFKEKVGSLFNKAIWNIQPMYEPAFRAPMQRNKTFNMIALFTAQTYQLQNQLRRGILQVRNGQASKGVMSMLGVVASLVLYAALRDKTQEWRGNDTNMEAELINSAAGAVSPLGSKLLQGVMTISGDEAGLKAELGGYDVTVPVTEAFNDAYDAIAKLDSDKYNTYGKVMEFAKAAGQAAGIPVKYMEEYTSLALEQLDPSFEYDKLKLSDSGLKSYDRPSDEYDKLIRAIAAGKTDVAADTIAQIKEKGGTLKKFLASDAGGKKLTSQQKYELSKLWGK